MRLIHRRSVAFLLAVATGVLLAAPAARAQTEIFRDDFNGSLQSGWQIVREESSFYSLSARNGFLRILTQRGGLGQNSNAKNIFLREITGDFIIESKLEFNPNDAKHTAGIIAYVDDFNAVVLGLSYAEGERGTFRGVASISAIQDQEGQRAGAFYDESITTNPNLVYLRMLRSGDQFVVAFSDNGTDYTELATFTNPLPSALRVGVLAGNGDAEGCGEACDIPIPGDFDYFVIKSLGAGTIDPNSSDPNTGEPNTSEPNVPQTPKTLQGISIEGPDSVTGGVTQQFVARASYSDGSSADVSGSATWTLAPAGRGSISNGALVTAAPSASQNVTIVAQVVDNSDGTTRVQQAWKVVTVLSAADANTAPSCGAGLLGVMPLMLIGLSATKRVYRRAG